MRQSVWIVTDQATGKILGVFTTHSLAVATINVTWSETNYKRVVEFTGDLESRISHGQYTCVITEHTVYDQVDHL